jgi:hypothetical protein
VKFFQIIKRFGLSLGILENAPITLNALLMDNMFGTTDEISFILKQQYINRAKENIFTIIGSAGLLGNPVGLVN